MKITAQTVNFGSRAHSIEVRVEVFSSTQEAIKHLGEEQALKLLNYAHALTVKSKALAEVQRKRRK